MTKALKNKGLMGKTLVISWYNRNMTIKDEGIG